MHRFVLYLFLCFGKQTEDGAKTAFPSNRRVTPFALLSGKVFFSDRVRRDHHGVHVHRDHGHDRACRYHSLRMRMLRIEGIQ